jgi:hypothetical protein
MRPGLASEAVEATFDELGLSPPRGLLDLYGWRDGIDIDRYHSAEEGVGQPHLFPFVRFRSLDEAVEAYRSFLKMNLPSVEIWPRRFFPILDQQLLQYAIACDPSSPDWGQVWLRDLELVEESSAAFNDLGELVTAVTSMFDRGHFYYSEATSDIQPIDDADLPFSDTS